MNSPKRNWILYGLYNVSSIIIFVVALIFPAVRYQIAPAPLRDFFLPPPAPVLIPLLYSTEKEAWLKQVIKDFEASGARIEGHPIRIEPKEMGSREMYLSILNEKEKPVLISPASSLQINLLQELSANKFNRPLISNTSRPACQSVFTTPLVLVAWRERAAIVWENVPREQLWRQLHHAAVNPKGWGEYGHPEWGFVKFGHTNPLTSNSGLMTILLMADEYFGSAKLLTTTNILADPEFKTWFIDIENTIASFGDSTGTYMKDMVAYGPSVYDVVTVYEATAIEQADNAVGRYGELRVYYPDRTILSDHPFCILNAEWVTNEQAQAAQIFVDYLLSKPAQEKALLEYGFRPVDTNIPLDQPGSPLNRYATNGLKIQLPPQITLPPGDVLNTLLEFWDRNVQR